MFVGATWGRLVEIAFVQLVAEPQEVKEILVLCIELNIPHRLEFLGEPTLVPVH